MTVFRLTDELAFPPADFADDEGLLAVGGDLSTERLLVAYRNGIFPWYSGGQPILWWSPNPRMILWPEELHVSRSLKRVVKRGVFRVTADTAFEEVVYGCATTPRRGERGTWITPAMHHAYCALHHEGYAHSMECWEGDALAGGLYGVALGGCFFGESMFTRQTNASKVAMVHLAAALVEWDFDFVDCQLSNPHLDFLGAQEIPRRQFLELLRDGLRKPGRHGKWTLPKWNSPLDVLASGAVS